MGTSDIYLLALQKNHFVIFKSFNLYRLIKYLKFGNAFVESKCVYNVAKTDYPTL